jgi:hypothetical protein
MRSLFRIHFKRLSRQHGAVFAGAHYSARAGCNASKLRFRLAVLTARRPRGLDAHDVGLSVDPGVVVVTCLASCFLGSIAADEQPCPALLQPARGRRLATTARLTLCAASAGQDSQLVARRRSTGRASKTHQLASSGPERGRFRGWSCRRSRAKLQESAAWPTRIAARTYPAELWIITFSSWIIDKNQTTLVLVQFCASRQEVLLRLRR